MEFCFFVDLVALFIVSSSWSFFLRSCLYLNSRSWPILG